MLAPTTRETTITLQDKTKSNTTKNKHIPLKNTYKDDITQNQHTKKLKKLYSPPTTSGLESECD